MWSVRRIMVLTLCALAVQGSLLLAMNAAAVAAEEEECAAPVCAMICDDEELAMSDELKTMCACDMADDMSGPASEDRNEEYLFVQRAESATLSNETLTLYDVGDVIWFTDRPTRAAGVWKESEYLALFEPSETSDDTNSFSADPPNAVLGCTLDSTGEELSVTVELTDPVVSSSDDSVSYSVVILEDVTGLFPSEVSMSVASTMHCTDVQLFVDLGYLGVATMG